MASLNNIAITFEIEPIVKVACTATDCKNNLMNEYQTKFAEKQAACMLKYITISQDGKCYNYELVK